VPWVGADHINRLPFTVVRSLRAGSGIAIRGGVIVIYVLGLIALIAFVVVVEWFIAKDRHGKL
jgi:hypothetical protein